jgi:hypothetical protein
MTLVSTQQERCQYITDGLPLDLPGLEIAPLHRPTVLKSDYNVYYTDYATAEESRKKHSNYEHDEIMEIDFVWTPGRQLIRCVPPGVRFDWAIASHVMEHVPDPVGWSREIFEVLSPGGCLSLVLPDKRSCFDRFRRETEVADLVDAWIRCQRIPSPRQIYDFLSRSIDDSSPAGLRALETARSFEDAARHYTDEQALSYVVASWVYGDYLDAHCSVFTPESFVDVFSKLNAVGLLNAAISQPIVHPNEFFVKLTKLGEPRVAHPGVPHAGALGFGAPQMILRKNFLELTLRKYRGYLPDGLVRILRRLRAARHTR